MRMKCYSKFFVGILSLGLLAGCNNDELTGNEPGSEWDGSAKDAVYMNVQVQLPVAGGSTRSTTGENGGSSDGTEVGKDYENEVKSVLLVLADKKNEFIAYGVQEGTVDAIASGKVSATQKISKSTLATYYNNGEKTLTSDECKIYVYAFCNPTTDLKNIIEGVANNSGEFGKKNWCDAVGSVIETPSEGQDNAVWGGSGHNQGFLMSTANATKALKQIPANLSDWDSYTSVDKAFNLSGINNSGSDKEVNNTGAIPVERAVARFDFKDGSAGNNTYVVIKSKAEGEGATEKTVMKIQLQKMALVNMSKNFYYLRRVSDNGLAEDVQICGTETSDNYVVDTDADVKFDNSIIKNNDYDKYFNFCLGHVKDNTWAIDVDARKQWYTSNISEVLDTDKESDNWNDKKYKIWRYVTENTIPGEDIQKNGISTGVIFKGKMIAGDDANDSLTKALEKATGNSATDPILYLYSNNLYVTWKEVRAAAILAGTTSEFYKAVFGTPNNTPVAEKEASDSSAKVDAVYSADTTSPDYLWNEWQIKDKENTEKQSAFKAAATSSKFTIYQSSQETGEDPGYYCYYFYWNRHNDNGNNGVMGPMEFGVVRNNVYKLAVTKIDRLGHPRISENDPDPLDPDDPDEKGDVYLTLSVEVLPWTVRVNNIEF